MRAYTDLHEEIDEVNLFLKEWQTLVNSQAPGVKNKARTELRFASRAITRAMERAKELNVSLELQLGTEPILARQDRRPARTAHRPAFSWLIPSDTVLHLTQYRRFTIDDGSTVTYVGNDRGMLPLTTLARTIAAGGELRVAGSHVGDWASV